MPITVSEHAGHYHLAFAVVVNAPPARVTALATDYARLRRLSPNILSSTVLAAPSPDRTEVRVVFHACVWFFCKTLHKTEWVYARPGGVITTEAVPGLSDFRRAVERWQFLPQGAGTLVTYRSEVTPKFVVPPLIGPWLIRGVMRRDLTASVKRFEQLAAHGSVR